MSDTTDSPNPSNKDGLLTRLETEIGISLPGIRGFLDNDSLIGSCDCLTKTPDPSFHQAGCKYRLIYERDDLRRQVADMTQEHNQHNTDRESPSSSIKDYAIELWDMATTASVRFINGEWDDERLEQETIRFTELLHAIVSKNAIKIS